jgi:DNA-binding transcriptional regulator YdaS (Cro superfamily)
MTLSEYIKAQRGNGKALADRLGISLSSLSQIAHNSEGTSPARCVAIEQATGGTVTRKDLRPDWKETWPELAYSCCKGKRKTRKAAKG